MFVLQLIGRTFKLYYTIILLPIKENKSHVMDNDVRLTENYPNTSMSCFFSFTLVRGIFLLSKVDKVTRQLMKRDTSLIAAISGAEVEVASI